VTKGVVNFYLLEAEGKLTLVDAGAPGDRETFERVVRSLGRTLADLDERYPAAPRVTSSRRRSGASRLLPPLGSCAPAQVAPAWRRYPIRAEGSARTALRRPRSRPSLRGGPEALFVLRGDNVECVSAQAIDLVRWDITGSSIRDSILDWREPADASDRFEALLRSTRGDLPVEIRIRTLDIGVVVASIRDARPLIARSAAEAALGEAEAKYRSLVEQIPAIVYADDGEVTTYVNPQIEQILGSPLRPTATTPTYGSRWCTRPTGPRSRQRARRSSRAKAAT